MLHLDIQDSCVWFNIVFFIFRKLVPLATMVGITATPISLVPSILRTFDECSMTAATSFSACTFGAMSFCDDVMLPLRRLRHRRHRCRRPHATLIQFTFEQSICWCCRRHRPPSRHPRNGQCACTQVAKSERDSWLVGRSQTALRIFPFPSPSDLFPFSHLPRFLFSPVFPL